MTAPVRDAYREGAAAGYRANAPAGDGSSGAPSPPSPSGSAPPPWAQRLARRQHLTHAGLVAGQAIREGDRPSGGQGPDLKGKA